MIVFNPIELKVMRAMVERLKEHYCVYILETSMSTQLETFNSSYFLSTMYTPAERNLITKQLKFAVNSMSMHYEGRIQKAPRPYYKSLVLELYKKGSWSKYQAIHSEEALKSFTFDTDDGATGQDVIECLRSLNSELPQPD